MLTINDQSLLRISEALAVIRPDLDESTRLSDAVRCLLFDVCNALGESSVGQLLGESWAGDVLRKMQNHDRRRQAARRENEELNNPENARKRREERQERHEKRLLLKKARDERWREAGKKLDQP